MNSTFQSERFFAILTVIAVLAVGAGSAMSQQPPPQDPAQLQRPRRVEEPGRAEESGEVVRINTDLVPIDVAVTDSQGKPVKNLSVNDFKVFEDGVERNIAFFNLERRGGDNRPIAVVFALDVSGSMSPQELERLRSAMHVFVEHLGDRTSLFSIMTFGMSAKTIQSFTNDRQKLERAFDRLAREPNGLSTHTYDAVDDAVRMLVRHAPKTREQRLIRRAVVVVTDGFPVGDTVAPATVIERANAADVTVFTVTLPSYSRLLAAADNAPLPTPLDVSGLVEKTGGTNVYATERNFDPLFKSIAEEVASTYVLAFYPSTESKRDGKVHTLRVQGPNGLTLRQSRQEYKNDGK
jgi:Ca-activated chloride channel family protein